MEEIYDYGFFFNDLENVNDIKRNWTIDMRIPVDYEMTFKDADMNGNNFTLNFNDRQAIIFFKRKQ
jgi:hypothetical protein